MKRLYRITTAVASKVSSIDNGATLPQDTYWGFVIGPDSDFDECAVVVGEGRLIVPAGVVVPCGPFDGAPQIELTRGTVDDAVIEVLGLTHPCELACKAGRRRKEVAGVYSLTAGAEKRIPGMRRHIQLLIDPAAASGVTLTLRGYDKLQGSKKYTLASGVDVSAAAGADGYSHHIGGTDQAELYPEYGVVVSGADATMTVIYAEDP